MKYKKYKEIFKLAHLLSTKDISFEFKELNNGYQIIYNNNISIIQHDGSYGAKLDLLEINGLLTYKERQLDSVVGGLTARIVLNRILKNEKMKNYKVR